jgi:hypothetical protein
MTFYDDFPSLRHENKLYYQQVENIATDLVVKHCIDKQKVRDAIKDARKKWCLDRFFIVFDELEKELGL